MAHAPESLPDAGRPTGARREREGVVSRWVGRIFSAIAVTGLGVLIGQQYMQPNKRVLPVLAAVVIAGLAWRLDLVSSIGVLIFLLPYPKGTVFGTTNTALALLIAIVWLVNASLRRAPAPRRSPVDMAVLGLMITYICSFYNVTDPEAISGGLGTFEVVLSSVLCYYVIIANVNTTKALRKIHVFQMLSALSVFLLGLYELRHPGVSLGGGWINFGGSTGSGAGEDFARHGVRIGSAFGDYELLSEFCVLSLLLAVFLWARANSNAHRALISGFIVLTLFVMFSTVTRGAIFSLVIGLLTMLWTTRRRVRFVPLVIGVSVFVGLFIGMNFYVSHFTASGDMFGRLSQTHFENGVPDSRIGAWGPALLRATRHPWVGHGPYYVLKVEEGFFWPHNVYLWYANTVGFVGLGFFLLILFGLARATRPSVDNLRHPDYARSFQIVAQAQFVAFVANEFKIEYMRNTIYQTVVWAMFSIWVATYYVVRNNIAAERAAEARTSSAGRPGTGVLPAPAR